MTVDQWLSQAVQTLSHHQIGTARLDALVLLEDCLKTDRSNLLAHTEIELTSQQLDQLNDWLDRRCQHEPLAYIRGHTEFYGREFMVNQQVLEPRPESETMIDLLKSLTVEQPTILDVGTGSGALGITAALEIDQSKVSLLDIDESALEVAKQNLKLHQLDLPVIKKNLLAGLDKSYDVLLCNLPYVPDDYAINQAALKEPRLAIFGGPDGLNLYRRLFNEAAGRTKPPKFILTEALPPQHDQLRQIAEQQHYQQQKADDFIQLFCYNK